MNRQTYDIETLARCLTVTFRNYDTGEVNQFVCYPEQNDYVGLYRFWKSITHLISFNGEHFDNPVMYWLFEKVNASYWGDEGPTGAWIAYEAYQLAQEFINRDEEEETRKRMFIARKNLHCISIDLFLYWSRGIRMSKKLSLKAFAHALGMSIVEMPIHHTQVDISPEELRQVLAYNLQDVEVTHRLAQELRDQINLRGWIQQTYRLPCWSDDAPKIGQRLILESYSKLTGQNKFDLAKRRYIKPVPMPIGPLLPRVIYQTPFFQEIYMDMLRSVDTFSREYLYKNPDGSFVLLSYGIGGMHSIQKNQHWKAGPGIRLVTIDVASLYPTLIINNGYVSPELGVIMLEIYKTIRTDRLAAKRDGDIQKDTLTKLILNGFSGLCDSEVSWMYAPEQIIAMRMHGQMLLSKTIERLGLAGISIISVNTDGIELLLEDGQQTLLDKAVKQVEREFDVVFEADYYKEIFYRSVNDYLAIYETPKKKKDGKIEYHKAKGELVAKWSLDQANEFLIIPKALEAYWVHGTDPAMFIKKHQNVFDFCAAKKINKTYTVWYNNQQQQQLNRYLVATRDKGAYLYKVSNEKAKAKPEHVLKGLPVYLLNGPTDQPAKQYPIDHAYYIRKVQDVIRLFEPVQLTLFGSYQQTA